MNIAIMAQDAKKELMTQFCVAYSRIFATGTTGRLISEATDLNVIQLLPGAQGGIEQISSRVQCNEIDVVLFFRDPLKPFSHEILDTLFRLCDAHQVPFATNIATAEVLICALDRGDLDWREIVNPRSDYNRRRRGILY